MNNEYLSNIEYLILNEEKIDWEKLSGDPDALNSIVEIRLFRKRINWQKYLITHKDTITPDILNLASKHFKDSDYMLTAMLGIANEDFIRQHIDKFDFRTIILSCALSPEFLIEYQNKWKKLDNIKNSFKASKYIDLLQPEMVDVRLILETI